MTRRDDATLLQDLLNAARQAVAAVKGRRQGDLILDPIWALGLVKSLEIVGEAASHLSTGLCQRHPEIPWPQIVGVRHRLVHAYFDIDPEQVWKALVEDLPPLIETVERILAEEPPQDSA